VDFYQFWAVGQWLHQHGNANVYSDEFRERLGAELLEESKHQDDPKLAVVAEMRRNLETYSSPFLYALFGLCSTGRYAADFRCYQWLMLACLIFGIGVLCGLLRYSYAAALGAIAIFSAWFQPFASDLRVGNVNSLQFAALAAYLWVVARMRWSQRDVLGGAILGLAVTFKPNLVPVAFLLAVYWAFSGQTRRLWLHLAGAACGAIAAILFASAEFRDFRCWTDWISSLRSMPDQIITVGLGNFSPAQFLTELYGLNAVIPVAFIFGVLAVAMLWSRQRNKLFPGGAGSVLEESPGLFAVSIGYPLVVLMPHLAWLHYYVLTIPAIAALRRGNERWRLCFAPVPRRFRASGVCGRSPRINALAWPARGAGGMRRRGAYVQPRHSFRVALGDYEIGNRGFLFDS
jgi:hypothetical protein